ncbi:uncharacterized protein EI90DRAFT_3118619 [Cantharellus anzutake]|uniref:uncharacterized protein n=1 Tax=Cantharellus anzutake TaxID=1750568 RepID=UPI001904C361|nr:uncharacterized protein EI90DRAFT_3118619 [Cantharellus anzutake]KAF8338189.1 hypothetical protein EI90DRAFT_3118619 [Cantharellus anzutake]
MSETPLLPSRESNSTFPPVPPPVKEIKSTTVATVAAFLSAVEAQFLAITLGEGNWHSANTVLIFSLLFTLLGGLKGIISPSPCQIQQSRALSYILGTLDDILGGTAPPARSDHLISFAHRDALRLSHPPLTGRIIHSPQEARFVDLMKASSFDSCFSGGVM